MSKVSSSKVTPAAAQEKEAGYDNEDIFLLEVLRAYTFWKGEVRKAKRAGHDPAREQGYVDAYRLLLHQFSRVDTADNE